MTCAPGKPCWEGFKRRRALGLLGLMFLIFVGLSIASFLPSRGQVVPIDVEYAGYSAVRGKRIFQAYNCMGCHTIVGNGAYFGPDLTKLYNKVGPAWIEAFLPSAGGWPASGAVMVKLLDEEIAAEAGARTIDEYLSLYPGAAERINRRGSKPTMMPNLPLSRDEIGHLIAFLKYTSEMNTEGWPPEPRGDDAALALAGLAGGGGQHAAIAPPPGFPTDDPSLPPVERGANLVKMYGCVACHALDGTKLVGPGWGGLHGSEVKLADGSTITADEAYLSRSIMEPDVHLVEGFPPGSMPAFGTILKPDQVSSIVAYISSLGGN